jgi:hypothetical protein
VGLGGESSSSSSSEFRAPRSEISSRGSLSRVASSKTCFLRTQDRLRTGRPRLKRAAPSPMIQLVAKASELRGTKLECVNRDTHK